MMHKILLHMLVHLKLVVIFYLEHDVNDIEQKVRFPKCVNGVTNMEGLDDKVVEGFDDGEDDKTIAFIDGFEGIDVNVPINHGDVVPGLLGGPKKKIEDDAYFSDELDNSYPDESGDDERPKFKRFRKEKLNKDYKFKWGMKFNSLADFREVIREWSILNGRKITFVKNESYKVRVEFKAKCVFFLFYDLKWATSILML